MNSHYESFPTAITSPGLGQDNDAILAALKWAVSIDPHHKILLVVASRQHIRNVPLLQSLEKSSDIQISTSNRTPARYHTGPVVAAQASPSELQKLPTIDKVSCIAATPWGLVSQGGQAVLSNEFKPWVLGTKAEVLGGPLIWETSDEVLTLSDHAREILDSLDGYLFGSMSIRGNRTDVSRAKKAVMDMRALGPIPLTAVEQWAWEHHWGSSNLEALIEYCTDANNGKRLRC